MLLPTRGYEITQLLELNHVHLCADMSVNLIGPDF